MSEQNNQEIFANFKVVLVGNTGVGKSSIIDRYMKDKYTDSQPVTIGVDFHSKVVTLPDLTQVRVSFWDTAGQERFRTLTPNFYRGAHGAIIVFDLGNRESFESLSKWLDELRIYSCKPAMLKLLIGNKLDLEPRFVEFDEAVRFSRLHKLIYAEVSAKTNEGVSKALLDFFSKIYDIPDLWIDDGLTKAGALRISNQKSSGTNSGCKC